MHAFFCSTTNRVFDRTILFAVVVLAFYSFDHSFPPARNDNGFTLHHLFITLYLQITQVCAWVTMQEQVTKL